MSHQVQVRAGLLREIEKALSALLCVYPNCESGRHWRGLCREHGAICRELMESGLALEEDLIRRGLLQLEDDILDCYNTERAAFLASSTARGRA